MRSALQHLVSIEGAVVGRLEHEHFLALSDAQEELAVAFTRADNRSVESVPCAGGH